MCPEAVIISITVVWQDISVAKENAERICLAGYEQLVNRWSNF